MSDEAVRKELEFEDTPEFWKALAQRVIAGCRPGRNLPRWAVVSQRTGHGSTYSRDLCRYFGVDPDETLKRRARAKALKER